MRLTKNMRAPNQVEEFRKEFRKWVEAQMDWNLREGRSAMDKLEQSRLDLLPAQLQHLHENYLLWRARAAAYHSVITELDKRFKGES